MHRQQRLWRAASACRSAAEASARASVSLASSSWALRCIIGLRQRGDPLLCSACEVGLSAAPV